MFNICNILAGLIFAGIAVAAAAAPQPKETAKFDGNTLVLASREGDEKTGESLREYIPEGENFDAWTKLASVHVFPKLDDPLAAVANLKAELEKEYPGSPSNVLKNAETGEAMIDFVILLPDSRFVEWDVMKYVKNPKGGLTMYQYALRVYGEKQSKEFLTGLKQERVRLVALMAKSGLQVTP